MTRPIYSFTSGGHEGRALLPASSGTSETDGSPKLIAGCLRSTWTHLPSGL